MVANLPLSEDIATPIAPVDALNEQYRIELPKLAPGKHDFTFEVGDAFFAAHAESFVTHGSLQIDVTIQRSRTLIDLRIRMKGWLELACDRCLRGYHQPLSTEHRLVFTHNTSIEEVEGAEVQYIPAATRFLELAQDFYDYIHLSVPYRRIPPDCPGANCPPEVLALLAESEKPKEVVNEPDPRWAALQALRGKEETD